MNDLTDHPTDHASPGMQPSPRDAASEMLAPEAAQAALVSISQWKRGVAQNHSARAPRNGLTVEDMVREEIRPMLRDCVNKDLVREEMRPMLYDWLNKHLSAMVEQLVRAELERLSASADV